MKTIWKFPLEMQDEQVLSVPAGAQALAVQVQAGQPCLWALVDPEAPPAMLSIRIHGTGHPISDGLAGYEHIGTFQLAGGALIFHAFRASPPEGQIP